MFYTALAFILVLASFLIAVASLIGFAVFQSRKDKSLRRAAKSEKNRITFLFENEDLADSTSTARQILASSSVAGSDWAKLVSVLKPRFEALDDLVEKTFDASEVTLLSNDGTSQIETEVIHGMLRLELSDVETSTPHTSLDRHSLLALESELETHRSTARLVPFLNWRENAKGEIIWANRAYLDIVEIVHSGNTIAPWPPTRLFDNTAASSEVTSVQRAALKMPDGEANNWFDIHSAAMESGMLFTAMPVDDLVRAEATLSEFVGTLTETFAHLPIGLAIFNQKRKLSIFNPALTDLTMLPAGFLCGQPTLFAFLDRLRDKRMMPEPKDYKTWRQEMSDLEEKAVNGTYLETWFLPTGQTYRVTGRPHPDGAVAFLIEDISSEVSLTHRFKHELEMGQAALDALDDAVAVFTAGGVLSMCNTAYAELWKNDPSTTVSDVTVSDATYSWNQNCSPTPVWRQLRGFIKEQGGRKRWSAPVTLKDGRVLNCHIVPMTQGATLVSFILSQPEQAQSGLEPVLAHAN